MLSILIVSLFHSSLMIDGGSQQPRWFYFDVSTSTAAVAQWSGYDEEL